MQIQLDDAGRNNFSPSPSILTGATPAIQGTALAVGTLVGDNTGDTPYVIGHKIKQCLDDQNVMNAELYSTIPGTKQDNFTDDSAVVIAYLSALGSTRATIVIRGVMLLNANVTFPKTVSLVSVNGGMLKRGISAIITINGFLNVPPWQFFDNTAGGSGKFTGAAQNAFVYDEWFGALADNTTDCTPAFNLSAAFAHGAGDIPRYQLAGTYKLTGTTYGIGTTSASATAPSIIGAGKKKTIWSYPGVAIAFKCIGGSTLPQEAIFQGISFIGDSSSIAIELAGVVGFKPVRCEFRDNLIGVRFHNELSGQYTEYCLPDNCEWRVACITAIAFKVSAGQNSFNGCGWEGRCMVNASPTGPVIDIGPGCNVYHGSLDAQVWMVGQTGAALTFNASFNGLGREVSGTLAANWTGTTGNYSVKFSSGEVRQVTLTNSAATATWFSPLTATATTAATINNSLIRSAAAPGTVPFAAFSTEKLSIETTSSNQITLADGKNVYLSGKSIRINGLTTATGANVTNGTALRCDIVGIASDSSISFTGGQQNQRVALASGVSTIDSLMRQVNRSIDIYITASNYDYRYEVVVSHNGTGGAGFEATYATLRTFNNGGTTNYGAPVFTADTNGRLVITAPTTALTFTGAFTGGETSGTLSGNWVLATGVYNVAFSNGDIRAVTLTNNATTAAWTTDAVLSGAATAAATASNYQTTGFNAYIAETQVSSGLQGAGHTNF